MLVSKLRLFAIPMVASLLLAAGCGNKGVDTNQAAMAVSIAEPPMIQSANSNIAQINLDIRRVEIEHAVDGWVVLGTPNRIVNILAIRKGVNAALVDGQTIGVGSYGQMRLILGPNNTVVLNDGSAHELTIPSGMQSGLKMTVNFEVGPGTTRDVYIDFEGRHSIHLHSTGSSKKYILRPTVRAFDVLETGSIAGRLVDEVSGAPLVGVAVTAQALDKLGRPYVVQTALTGADGSYEIDLLPARRTYWIVSQPLTANATYHAVASSGILIDEARPVAIFDASFKTAAEIGAINGLVTPIAMESQTAVVYLLQDMKAGLETRRLISRFTPTVVGPSFETFAFDRVPAGIYVAHGIRTTTNAAGEMTEERIEKPVQVEAGITVDVSLAYLGF